MKISLVNDWKYLFWKDAIGGRLASFTFVYVGWIRTGMVDINVDGFTVVILGLGLKVSELRNAYGIMRFMKQKLLLVVAVVVATGAVLALGNQAVDHYQNYKNKNQAQAVPTVSVTEANRRVESVKTAAAGEYQSLVASYNQAVAQCQKGSAAYAKLTAFVQKSTPAPVCPAPQQ